MFFIYILTNSARVFPFLYILAHSSVGKESTCNAGDLDSIGKDWVGKIPWQRERLPTPVFRPGEFHGLYRPWDHKELDTTERLSLANTCYFCLFDNDHTNQCEVIRHCSFDLHFFKINDVKHFFNVFVAHLYVFLEKCYLGLLPIFY